ncbi:hypothetical protein K3495_g6866 [Podosphaera aphanis]|nr:hypothetical protein K3495_g6866 [Podosphaera aphanis]
MAKRKANNSNQIESINKKSRIETSKNQTKIIPLDQSNSEDDSEGGVSLQGLGFKINKDFAKKFEHNRKREELQKLEEKYSKTDHQKREKYGDKYDEDSESSDDEEEDEVGFLATEALDAQISATLQAIRSKDPIVYNEKFSFYTPIEEEERINENGSDETKRHKPMYLKDYHRENLLKELSKQEDENKSEEEALPKTFAQEQEALQTSLVKEIHAVADESDADEDGGNFLVPKKGVKLSKDVHPSRKPNIQTEVDVTNAERDPETFLSNFMAARAWLPTNGARFQPLESDDESEDERAEKFEAAYNLRFEDPAGSNEVLKSYARDVVAAKSVRRDEKSGRKKIRDAQREKKELEKQIRDEEKAQLRRLKIEEMEERLKMIKKAAGFRENSFDQEKIMKLLDDSWDDEKWMDEMTKYFGEDYYADHESDGVSDTESKRGGKKKIRKPKWDDDIDIKDILPEFDDEVVEKVSLSDPHSDSEVLDKVETQKERKHDKQAKKKEARLERKRIEELVDNRLNLEIAPNSKQPSRFRYRETSPVSFGLTARDILLAPDTSLNQFAGLKKMATFRDPEKKRKDKKSLGKKARLRQWRKETFGNEDGPEIVIGPDAPSEIVDPEIPKLAKKKKRSRKNKQRAEVSE